MSDHNQSWPTVQTAVPNGATACRSGWPTNQWLQVSTSPSYPIAISDNGVVSQYNPTQGDEGATDWIVDYKGDKPPDRT